MAREAVFPLASPRSRRVRTSSTHPGLPHEVDPAGDAVVQGVPVEGEADVDRRFDLRVFGQGRGEGSAGELDDLEGADDPADVVDGDLLRSDRVEVCQSRVGCPPVGVDLAFEA